VSPFHESWLRQLAIWLKTKREHLALSLNPMRGVVSVYWAQDGACRSSQYLRVAHLPCQRVNIPGSAKAVAEAMLEDME
jgi:hypothetical protein